MEASLQWLRDLADALDEGLDLLANGRLAPQIFPPAQMALVLKAVNRQLNPGWAVSSDKLWMTYREVMVTVAAVEVRFRLFIKIPIYNHAQQYTRVSHSHIIFDIANGVFDKVFEIIF